MLSVFWLIKIKVEKKALVDSCRDCSFISNFFRVFEELKANAGAPTNFEVLDFLRSRGAGKDPTRCLTSIASSEYKVIFSLSDIFSDSFKINRLLDWLIFQRLLQVYDYLEQTAACNQTREIIHEFLEKCKSYDLAKAEILNIINIRPSSVVEIDPIIEECETRFGDSAEELVESVTQILPPPPSQMESDDHDTDSKTIKQPIKECVQQAQEFYNLGPLQKLQTAKLPIQVKWIPQLNCKVKLNVEGSAFQNPCPVGAGVSLEIQERNGWLASCATWDIP
ncbi:hypothetical protein M9H77_20464 [Catharanthus roseus]|uniref:Uncharacterized protein n=1 Tax=Catharanthus roseus TaxID=4058 RepID=A0ACC0ANT3_CATRO|nr:hypothetical protein M9H77_20464 [Catharanthus roseus]